MLSGNGKEFVNDIIKEFTDLIGTEQIFTLAYSKQENAIAERALKEVQRQLRAIVYHKNIHYDWSVYVHLLQRILNTEVHLAQEWHQLINFFSVIRLHSNGDYFYQRM